MVIQTGLFHHMVLQRAAGNACDALITGTASGAGPVRVRVTRRGSVVRGFASRAVGRARGGRFTARLRGLPAGGPYDVELTVRGAGPAREILRVRDVLVGDVWLLAGQSNMHGFGRIVRPPAADPAVRACYMNDEWDTARDPIHNLGESVDEVHNGWPDPDKPRRRARRQRAARGAGPGVPFALAMRRLTGVPQGLIPCAHGGTSMSQWDPALKALGPRSLYGALCRRLRKNGGRAAGALWYQGESDTGEATAPHYEARLKRFIRALRRETRDPALPFVMVQLARVFNRGAAPLGDRAAAGWNRIQEIQRRVPERVPHCAAVPAIDLPLDDQIHVSEAGMQRLGPRLAGAMAALRREPKAGSPPPALDRITVGRSPARDHYEIRVAYRHIVGRLTARGEPLGFALIGQNGAQSVYRVDLDGPTAVLHAAAIEPAAALHYGYGYAPVCTITDEADRSLPVFGPMSFDSGTLRRQLARIPPPAAFTEPGATPLAVKALVSGPHPVPAGGVARLACPARPGALPWQAREFPSGLWDLHCDLFNCAPRDVLAYFRCVLTCPRPMKLVLGLGYDGPIRVWVDRAPLFCDPKGINPAGLDKARIPFKARRGRHELLVAMTSNAGCAWGIKVRALRTDLTPRQRARPKSIRLPVFSV